MMRLRAGDIASTASTVLTSQGQVDIHLLLRVAMLLIGGIKHVGDVGEPCEGCTRRRSVTEIDPQEARRALEFRGAARERRDLPVGLASQMLHQIAPAHAQAHLPRARAASSVS